MEKSELQNYIYENFPLTVAMGIEVKQASEQKVVFAAPFIKNKNVSKTVFAGSLYSIATLACWTLLYLNLKNEPQILITDADIRYQNPVEEDFEVSCLFPEDTKWERFIKMLHLKSKSRIPLHATVYQKNRLCVNYQGRFAVFNP